MYTKLVDKKQRNAKYQRSKQTRNTQQVKILCKRRKQICVVTTNEVGELCVLNGNCIVFFISVRFFFLLLSNYICL